MLQEQEFEPVGSSKTVRVDARIIAATNRDLAEELAVGKCGMRVLVEKPHVRVRRRGLQSGIFLRRHDDARGRVLREGERFQLGFAGNHAQGTLFRDGRHLLTPALERRIDDVAQRIPGFFIGRFDVRYRSVERFKAGEDLAIVELNGATAESTNIYDPDGSLLDAYRTLFRQWSLVFAIGAANRTRGAVTTPRRRLIRLVVAHLTSTPALALSD